MNKINKIDFKQQLYNDLPKIYRELDEQGDLEDFLKIFGETANLMLDEVQDYDNLFKVNDVDAKYLPYLAEMLGFTFPYDIPEEEQRKFVKVMPELYARKGTASCFEYLAREIFDWDVETDRGMVYNELETHKVNRVKLDFYIKTFEDPFLESKVDNFMKFAELFRPVNSLLKLIAKLRVQTELDLFENKNVITIKDLVNQNFFKVTGSEGYTFDGEIDYNGESTYNNMSGVFKEGINHIIDGIRMIERIQTQPFKAVGGYTHPTFKSRAVLTSKENTNIPYDLNSNTVSAVEKEAMYFDGNSEFDGEYNYDSRRFVQELTL